jgi:release factor glutamine methyltransferase
MPLSVRAVLSAAIAELSNAEIGTPRVDAEILLAYVLGVDRARLVLVGEVSSAVLVRFNALVSQRAEGYPLQHLTGSAPFRYIDLAVGPGVFVPRPETELIVDLAASRLASASVVVDLCSGSGAIALSIAKEFPRVRVIAVEQSATAGDWLTRNAAARENAGDHRIQIVLADIAEPDLLAEWDGIVDVVVSNPPYVPALLRQRLSREVRLDPDEAVFAGADGLALMPAVNSAAARLLRPGGLLVIEHDESHSLSVPELLSRSGNWTAVTDHLDLTGRPRFASAIRSGG